MCEQLTTDAIPFIIRNAGKLNLSAYIKSKNTLDTDISFLIDKYLIHYTLNSRKEYDESIFEYECFKKLAKEELARILINDNDITKIDDNEVIEIYFDFHGFTYLVLFQCNEVNSKQRTYDYLNQTFLYPSL